MSEARPQSRPRANPALVGAVLLALLAAATYLAFVKDLPFADPGYELSATFESSATLRTSNPVRIAGVEVGEVTGVDRSGDAAEVTFTVSEQGRPVHTDATVEIRPRLFLEGNLFLDLRPGSPSAPELPDGGVIPVTRTSTAVQLDQVLTALQADSRRDLQVLLAEYATALRSEPGPAEDAIQDPAVRGETAAEAINDSFAYGARAGRGTALVAEALLGTESRDLSGLIAAQRRVFGVLADREAQLRGLVSNLNTTAGALAAESASLGSAVRQLAPTLREARPSLLHLDRTLPALRTLAIELRPSIAELPGTIDAAEPWLREAGLLLSDRELGGLARLLSRSAPSLAGAARSSLGLFEELTLLGRCTSEVLVPTGQIVLDDASGLSTGQPNYRDFFYALVGTAGESQDFDGNGSFLRLQPGGGGVLASAENPGGGFQDRSVWARTPVAPLGTQPVLPASAPPFRTDVPCYRNAIPNLNGPAATPGPPSPEAAP